MKNFIADTINQEDDPDLLTLPGIKHEQPYTHQSIKGFMDDAQRALMFKISALFVASTDREGLPWAFMLSGRPGFINTPSPKAAIANRSVLPPAPLIENWRPGQFVSALGIDFESRQRNRMGATIKAIDKHAISFDIKQSYGDCKRQLTRRTCSRDTHDFSETTPAYRELTRFSPEAIRLIRKSDSLFVASFSRSRPVDEHQIAISHRCVKSGFVDVNSDRQLVFPDNSNTLLLNTLSSLEDFPQIGLLFIDYETGDLLHLTGHADIVWDGSQNQRLGSADRLIQFTLRRGYWVRGGTPLRWQTAEVA